MYRIIGLLRYYANANITLGNFHLPPSNVPARILQERGRTVGIYCATILMNAFGIHTYDGSFLTRWESSERRILILEIRLRIQFFLNAVFSNLMIGFKAITREP